MQWLFAALAGIGFVELFIRLPIVSTMSRTRAILSKVSAVLGSSRISDHWKERVLPAYALRLFGQTMVLALYLAVAFAPFALLIAIATAMDVPFAEFTLSAVGILYMTVLSLAYAKLRSRVATKL